MSSSANVTLTWHGSTPETSAIEQAFTDSGATHAHADNEDGSTVVVFHLATSHPTDILAGQIVGRALDDLRLSANTGRIYTQHDRRAHGWHPGLHNEDAASISRLKSERTLSHIGAGSRQATAR